MKQFIRKKSIVYFISCAAHASDLCLMLSPAEEAALLRAQEKVHEGGTGQTKNIISLRLDGIIYIHQKSWTIWINGRSIKPEQKIDSLRILKVTPNSVEIIWNPTPGEHHQICLKPNEVFQTSMVLPSGG